jgi:hypothetical protein
MILQNKVREEQKGNEMEERKDERIVTKSKLINRAETVTYLRVFVPFFWKNFIHDRIFLGAGSLAFQTLLSIVPILAVILSILNVFVLFKTSLCRISCRVQAWYSIAT